MASLQTINNELQRLANVNFNFYTRVTKQNQRKLQKMYAKTFKEIEVVIGRMYAKYDELTITEMRKFNRLVGIQKELTKTIATLLPGSTRLISRTNVKTSKIGYYGAGWNLEVPTGFNFNFTQISDEALAAAVQQTTGLINWRDSNRNNIARYAIDVKNSVTEGIAQGWSHTQMVKALKDDTVSASFKADRVIRTEANRAYNAGKLAGHNRIKKAAGRLGIPVQRFWIATIDQFTRPCHVTADGSFEDKKGLFHVCGYTAPAPGLFGVAKMDINCRCRPGTKINEKIPKTRRIQIEDKKAPYITFKDYLKKKNINIAA